MPRKGSASASAVEVDIDREGNHLTSGDMARMLHVDLKTIHNWVNQGHVTGSRTKGRHLRFDRAEIVRFMRAYGYPIGPDIGAASVRVLLEQSLSGLWVKALNKACHVQVGSGLFACALELSTGNYEIAVVDLSHDTKSVQQFVQAVREWEPTHTLALVGIGEKTSARRAFLNAGGSAALPLAKRAELKGLSAWLVGASETCPTSVEVAESMRS